MAEPIEKLVKESRRVIEGTRQANNTLFMNWWEVSMLCPHCRPIAMAYQSVIRTNDKLITEENGDLLREMKKCALGE